MLVNFDDLCPPDLWLSNKQEVVDNGKGMLGNFQICGKEVPRGYWVGVFHFLSEPGGEGKKEDDWFFPIQWFQPFSFRGGSDLLVVILILQIF